jgi:hypothetical protein
MIVIRSIQRLVAIAFFTLVLLKNAMAQGTPVVTHLLFYAKCSAEQALPQTNSKGMALVTLFYERDRQSIQVTGLLTGLSGQLSAAYLHYGKRGEKGDTVVNLMPIIQGRKISGRIPAPPRLLERLLLDEVYVDLKTTAFPNGELRGQTVGETDLNFGLQANGSQMVPPNNSQGTCLGGFHLAAGSDDLDYALLCRDLSGPATAGAIYEGDPGTNGVKIMDMPNIIGGNIFVGLIDTDDLPSDFFPKCIAGKYYVSVSTSAFPAGEVRAKIEFLGYLNSLAPVNANQPVPPPANGSPGFGMSFTRPNRTLDTLMTTLLYSGISASSVEIRTANPGDNGPLLTTMDATARPGLLVKKMPITDTLLSAFIAGKLYVNMPTTTVPTGEIRGQLKTSLRRGYYFDLCGTQQVPKNDLTALGMACGSVDQNECYFHYVILHDGLSGDVLSADLHRGNAGQNGQVLHPVDKPGIWIDENEDLADGEGPAIEKQETYFRINTAQYANGEVRGQVRRGLTCPLVSGVRDTEIRHLVMAPNPVVSGQILQIQLYSLQNRDAVCYLTDMTGRTVLKHLLPLSSGTQTHSIHLPHMPPGAYQLVLEDLATGNKLWSGPMQVF